MVIFLLIICYYAPFPPILYLSPTSRKCEYLETCYRNISLCLLGLIKILEHFFIEILSLPPQRKDTVRANSSELMYFLIICYYVEFSQILYLPSTSQKYESLTYYRKISTEYKYHQLGYWMWTILAYFCHLFALGGRYQNFVA